MSIVSSFLPLFVAISAHAESMYFFREDLSTRPKKTVEVRSQRQTDSPVIHFDFNSSEILEGDKPKLDALAADIENVFFQITGHADQVGSDQYNRTLSLMRAQAVVDYLKERGVDTDQIKVDGKGSTHPVGNDDQNRRVEIMQK